MFLPRWLRQTSDIVSPARRPQLGVEALGERINPSGNGFSGWSDWIDFVAPSAATHFYVVTPESDAAGSAATVTVVALDASNHRVSDYTGTIHFTSTDPKATLPADYTFTAADHGIHNFQETPASIGSQTITATDVSDGTVNGSATMTVQDGSQSSLPASFAVIAQPSAEAGDATRLAVAALDANGRPLSTYTGTIHFTSTDPAATLPADYTFTAADRGFHIFTATFATPDTQTITATDTASSDVTGTASITVNAAPVATRFAVLGGRNAFTGSATDFTVVALDAENHLVQDYTGTVHFTSSDSLAVLPADYTFTAADHGYHSFQTTLNSTGAQTITATDTATGDIIGKESVNVVAAPVAAKLVVLADDKAYVGSPARVLVVAVDANGRPVRDYSGTVTLTSTDSGATLPAAYTFTADDRGAHTFEITPSATGDQTITAADASGKVIGSVTLNVVDAPVVTHFAAVAYPNPIVGAESWVGVVALDANNQPVPTYTGTVHFTSSDSAATLPADYTFTQADRGAHIFAVTFGTRGTETLTVTDATDSSLTGSINVTAVTRPSPQGLWGGWF